MFARNIAAVALSAVTLVSAATNTTTSAFTIDPDSVELATRVSWCNAQSSACKMFCISLDENSCDTTTLEYECSCTNGKSPNLNEYMDTLPYFICKEAYSQCITAHPNDAEGQETCTTTIDDECGTKEIADASPIDASTTTSASATPTTTAAANSATTTSTSTGAAMPTQVPHARNGAAAVALAAMAYMI